MPLGRGWGLYLKNSPIGPEGVPCMEVPLYQLFLGKLEHFLLHWYQYFMCATLLRAVLKFRILLFYDIILLLLLFSPLTFKPY